MVDNEAKKDRPVSNGRVGCWLAMSQPRWLTTREGQVERQTTAGLRIIDANKTIA